MGKPEPACEDKMERQSAKLNIEFASRRPLFGLTILLVEDSRCCSQAVRMMSVKSGARMRRADCLRSARRHLMIYRPDVVMIDLGLPDGSGVELIEELNEMPDWSSAVVALSGDDGGPGKAQAMEAGAACFLTKPLQDILHFQQAVLSVANKMGGPHLFVARSGGKPLEMDGRAFLDDLNLAERRMRQALSQADTAELHYLAQFTRSVAKTAQDHELVDCAAAFGARLAGGTKWQRGGEGCWRCCANG
ncbi:MAG: response regulator [Rhodobacteraceae bacterium]|nr:response regulator [Paracoccaceae bacterium]